MLCRRRTCVCQAPLTGGRDTGPHTAQPPAARAATRGQAGPAGPAAGGTTYSPGHSDCPVSGSRASPKQPPSRHRLRPGTNVRGSATPAPPGAHGASCPRDQHRQESPMNRHRPAVRTAPRAPGPRRRPQPAAPPRVPRPPQPGTAPESSFRAPPGGSRGRPASSPAGNRSAQVRAGSVSPPTSPAHVRPDAGERRPRPARPCARKPLTAARAPAGAQGRQGACGQRAPDLPEQEPPPAPQPPGQGQQRGDHRAPPAARPGATHPTSGHGQGPRQEHARPERESTPGPGTPPGAPPHQQCSHPPNDRHSRQEAGHFTTRVTGLPLTPPRTTGSEHTTGQTGHGPTASGAKPVRDLVYPGVTTARDRVVTLQDERLGARPPPGGRGDGIRADGGAKGEDGG